MEFGPVNLPGLSTLQELHILELSGPPLQSASLEERVPWANLDLVCTLCNLAPIKLEKLPVRDSAFSQAANLHRLTCLEFFNCFELTHNVFLHLAGLVSRRHLYIRCINISENLDLKTLLPSLHRLTPFANGTQAC